jgi:hypothetical protein
MGSTNGCMSAKSRLVTVTAAITPSVSISYTGCPGNSLNFTATPTGGGPNPQYQWFVNNVSQGTGPSFVLNGATNGTQVYAKMTSGLSCASPQTVNSAATTINCITTAVPAINALENFTISPNPSPGLFTVKLKLSVPKRIAFEVIDVAGNIIYQRGAENAFGSVSKQIDLLDKSQGIYFLKTFIGNESFVHKLVIAR